jgi:hypothetical protein
MDLHQLYHILEQKSIAAAFFLHLSCIRARTRTWECIYSPFFMHKMNIYSFLFFQKTHFYSVFIVIFNNTCTVFSIVLHKNYEK